MADIRGINIYKCISPHFYDYFKITPASPVYSLDSSEHQRAASLLNLSSCCYSGPAPLGRSMMTLALKPHIHNTDQWTYRGTI